MDDAHVLTALEEALGRLEVELRVEDLPADARVQGGLCSIDGRPVVLLGRAAPTAERVAVLAAALARLDTSRIYLAPAVRERIERARR